MIPLDTKTDKHLFALYWLASAIVSLVELEVNEISRIGPIIFDFACSWIGLLMPFLLRIGL